MDDDWRLVAQLAILHASVGGETHDKHSGHRREHDPEGLGDGGAGTLANVVSCPGAASCKLAITRSRGFGQLLADSLREQRELVAAAPEPEPA